MTAKGNPWGNMFEEDDSSPEETVVKKVETEEDDDEMWSGLNQLPKQEEHIKSQSEDSDDVFGGTSSVQKQSKSTVQDEDEEIETEEIFDDEGGAMDCMPFIKHESVKELFQDEKFSEYKILLADIMLDLHNRAWLNYDTIKKELNAIRSNSIDPDDYCNVDTEINMYLRIINDIDQYRTRVANILGQAQADFIWIEEAYNLLFDVWVGKFSPQTSDKKREGEAQFILSFFFQEKAKRKELFELAKNRYNLLAAKMEALSRKITISQELLKLYPGGNLEFKSNTPFRAEEKKFQKNKFS